MLLHTAERLTRGLEGRPERGDVAAKGGAEGQDEAREDADEDDDPTLSRGEDPPWYRPLR